MSEFVKIKGKIKWPKVYTPEQFAEKETWNVTIYPDPEEMDKVFALQKAGAKNTIRKDDDGYYIKYSRPTTIKIKGVVQPRTPPKVFYNGAPFTEQIGNGSRATIVLDTYSHNTPSGRMAKAARLEAVDIEELVPYSAPERKEITGAASYY